MNKKLKLGVIGGGINSAVGQTHFIATSMGFGSEIVSGFFSRDEDQNKRTGDRFGIPLQKQYGSLDSFILGEKNQVDLVIVLTPTDGHYETLVKLLSSGFDVICEKSLVLNAGEAKEIQGIIKKNKNFLSVIYNYTGYAMVREMREIIASRDLGEILSFSINMPQQSYIKTNEKGETSQPQAWRLNEKSKVPHVSLDLGIHVVNLIDFLFSKNTEYVFAQQRSYGKFEGVIDFVQSTVCLEDEIVGNVCYGKSFLGEDNGLEIKIYGTKGSMNWCHSSSESIKLCDENGAISIITSSSQNLKEANKKRYHRFKPGHPTGFIEAFSNHYDDIFRAFLNDKTHNEFSFCIEDAIRDLQLLEMMTDSSNRKELCIKKPFEVVNKNVG